MAFGRRRVAVSVVVVLSILLAISLDSNIRSKVTRSKMMLATDAEVRVENDAEVANVMEASAGEVASVNPGSVASEAPFTADTGDTGDTADTGEPGVVATSPTAAAIVEPSPGNAASSSSSDAFCRCSQTGGNKPPHGLESFAEEELKKLLEEMRQELRIYIYSVDFHCDKRRPKGTNRGYMVEWNFYDRARSSSMRVLDPERATIFYIPTFTSCWRSQGTTRREGGESAGKRIQQMLKDVTKLPFLQRYVGKKHIWISAHDMGKAEPLLAWCDAKDCSQSSMDITEMLAKNGTVLANTADDLEMQRDGKPGEYGFNSSMDVSLVCNGDMPLASRSRSVKPKRPRRYSVFFAGRWDENYIPVRFIAIRSIEKAKLQKPTSFNRKIKPEAYEKGLADSELCLAPRGSRVWSPRLFEMIWFGCIPVIISSGYHLPASCFFDWRDFSIFIEDKDAHKAGQILKGYLDDPKRLEEMREKVFKIRKAFMWNDEETVGDAFELAMLDVYLKQQRRC